VQLRSGPGYKIRRSQHAWGTPLAVARLEELFFAYRLTFLKAPPIEVQDLSRRGGGTLRPHLSHKDGRDVDIRLPHRVGMRQWGKATRRNLDIERTWFLINTLIQGRDIEFIFLDRRLQRLIYRHAKKQGLMDTELREMFRWIVRHAPGHDGHLHVRFRKGKLGDGRQSKTLALALRRIAKQEAGVP
jgi:murein endopeptidase